MLLFTHTMNLGSKIMSGFNHNNGAIIIIGITIIGSAAWRCADVEKQ